MDNNKSCNTLSYDVLHKFLAKRLHVWYAKFRPVRASPAREEDEDPPHGEIGLVVSAGNTPSSAAEGPAFSLEDDNETAASAAAAPAAAQPASAAAAHAHPPPAPLRRLSDYDVLHVVHGIYKHCNLFEDCFPELSPAELLPA